MKDEIGQKEKARKYEEDNPAAERTPQRQVRECTEPQTRRQNHIEKERSREADDSNYDDIEAEELGKSDPLLEIGINKQGRALLSCREGGHA